MILSADNAKSLPKEVADKISLSEAKILEKAAANPDLKDNLAKVLLGTRTPQAATNLTEFLSKADPRVAKEVVATLAGLEHETMAKVLTETIGGKPGLTAMGDLVSKLPASSRPALAKVLKDFDPRMVESFFELAGKSDPKILGKVLETLSGANSKAIGKGLNVVMDLVGKMGVKMAPEVAGHLLKGLTRMVPLVGTLPALYSMGDLGLKAIDQNSPPELRFLAGVAQNGGELAKYVDARVREGLQTGADYAWKTMEAAKKKGGELANWAVQTVATSVPAQFAKKGFDFLVNSGLAPTQIKDTVYRFVQRTESAYLIAKDVYEREGWQGIANLASRVGKSAVGEFVRVLAPTVQVVKENVQSVVESVGKVLGKLGLEELTGWNLTPYWPSWAPQ